MHMCTAQLVSDSMCTITLYFYYFDARPVQGRMCSKGLISHAKSVQYPCQKDSQICCPRNKLWYTYSREWRIASDHLIYLAFQRKYTVYVVKSKRLGNFFKPIF